MTEQADRRLDPVAQAILALLAERGPDGSCTPQEVAERLAAAKRTPKDPQDLWRRYLQAVKEQALFLARQGQVVILRRSVIQDPTKPIKGLLRLGLPDGPWKAAVVEAEDDED